VRTTFSFSEGTHIAVHRVHRSNRFQGILTSFKGSRAFPDFVVDSDKVPLGALKPFSHLLPFHRSAFVLSSDRKNSFNLQALSAENY